jgi:very-short-patch-repair endonuclease
MVSLQAALKSAIQIVFQLEDSELAAEPLPDRDTRNVLLFFEAAEGGAGVLRRMVDEPEKLAEVAREALNLCHYDPITGEELDWPPNKERCEAACYDCLMSYGNQRDHRHLDRKEIRDFLLELTRVHVEVGHELSDRETHHQRLLSQCESDLERQWLKMVFDSGLRLPSHAQKLVADCTTRPDFLYEEQYVAIYVDGPAHEFPERKDRDRQQQECLEDRGWTVIRFGHKDNWKIVVARYEHVLGGGSRL